MILTPLPEGHRTILFNVTEIEEELNQVDCSIDMAEYLIWVLVDLAYPVFTPPWMAEPELNRLTRRVRDYHLSEVQATLNYMLRSAGYNGEELIVCTLGRAYCSISFIKESVG